MTARYLLCPGLVRSRADGDSHFIDAGRLAWLYGVRQDECLVLPPAGRDFFGDRRREQLLARVVRGELVALRPRADGRYSSREVRP